MDMEMQVETSARQQPWWQVVAIGRNPKRTLVRIIVLVSVCVVTFKFVLLPIQVDGISMLPTYREKSINCLNLLAYVFHEPRRGDVVGIRLAGRHIMYMKRIVGLPGEMVGFHEGRLVVNGRIIPEPYVKYPCLWEREPEQVRPDEYYVVGDNRSMALIDHTEGRARRERIMGKMLL
jgi:signal peptidase I